MAAAALKPAKPAISAPISRKRSASNAGLDTPDRKKRVPARAGLAKPASKKSEVVTTAVCQNDKAVAKAKAWGEPPVWAQVRSLSLLYIALPSSTR